MLIVSFDEEGIRNYPLTSFQIAGAHEEADLIWV